MPRKDGKPTQTEKKQARALRQLYVWAYGTGLGMGREQLIRNVNYLVRWLADAEGDPDADPVFVKEREAMCDGYCDAAWKRGLLDGQL